MRVSELSYVFDSEDGSSVWVPSLHTGELFVAVAESMSRSVRTPTGFKMLASDWCKIYAEPFSNFVSAVISEGWHNRSFRELIRGFVTTSIILLERMDKEADANALAARIGIEDLTLLDSLRAAMSHL